MAAVPNYFLNKEDFGKMGNSDRFSAPSNTYKAKDGFIHIMAGSNDRFRGLINAMNKPNLIEKKEFCSPEARIKYQKKLDLIVEKWTRSNNLLDLGKKLKQFSVPWGKVRSFSEFLQTSQAKQYLKKAEIKKRKIVVPGLTIGIPKNNVLFKKIVPILGQHNSEILKSIGYDKKKVIDLKKKKII